MLRRIAKCMYASQICVNFSCPCIKTHSNVDKRIGFLDGSGPEVVENRIRQNRKKLSTGIE